MNEEYYNLIIIDRTWSGTTKHKRSVRHGEIILWQIW